MKAIHAVKAHLGVFKTSFLEVSSNLSSNPSSKFIAFGGITSSACHKKFNSETKILQQWIEDSERDNKKEPLKPYQKILKEMMTEIESKKDTLFSHVPFDRIKMRGELGLNMADCARFCNFLEAALNEKD
jgi:hypothetical protein